MITKKDKENILEAFKTVDVKDMNIDHANEDIVKWFRFGSHSGMVIAAEIIRRLPEKKTPKKKKELTIS